MHECAVLHSTADCFRPVAGTGRGLHMDIRTIHSTSLESRLAQKLQLQTFQKGNSRTMKKRLSILLFLIAMVLLMAPGHVVRSGPHPVASLLECTQDARDACFNKAYYDYENCRYRGEDGGTVYTSCDCQSTRSYASCIRTAGCEDGYAAVQSAEPACFQIQ